MLSLYRRSISFLVVFFLRHVEDMESEAILVDKSSCFEPFSPNFARDIENKFEERQNYVFILLYSQQQTHTHLMRICKAHEWWYLFAQYKWVKSAKWVKNINLYLHTLLQEFENIYTKRYVKAFLVKKTLFYLLVPCLIALCSIILHSIIILLLCIPLDILCVSILDSNTAKLVMLSDILESSLSKSMRFFVNLTFEICAMFLRALGGAVSRLSPVALLFWWDI